jgi:hypothetical protein
MEKKETGIFYGHILQHSPSMREEVGSIDGLITLRPHQTVKFTYSIKGYFRNCSSCDYHMRNRPVASYVPPIAVILYG